MELTEFMWLDIHDLGMEGSAGRFVDDRQYLK